MHAIISILSRQPVVDPDMPEVSFIPMPTWVTSDRDLTTDILVMQKKGWTIRPMPDMTLFCWHHRVVTVGNNPMDFADALQLQAEIDEESLF